MTARLAKIFPYLLLAPAVIPLVWWSGLLYPFLVPKTLLLRGFGIATLATLVYLVLRGQPFFWNRLRPAVAWIPAALLLVAYLASALGVDFSMSFWSVFNRGDGLLTLTIIVGYFYCILLYAERDLLPRLLKIVAVVGTISAAIGLLQWFGYVIGFEIPLLPSGADRVGGPLGNAAFFAGYLGLTVFATLASIPDWDSRTMRRLMYYGAALQALVAVLTATRGTILALAVTLIVALVYFATRAQLRKTPPASLSARALRAARPSLTLAEMLAGSVSVRSFALITLVAFIILTGLFIGFRDQLSQSSFEPVRRIASISLTDATVSSRLFIWQNVSVEALKSPLLGAGAEHIAPLFDRVYEPTQILEQWFDRTHNSFLDYFVQYGIFGLALYLALLIAFGASAIRLFRTGDERGFYLTLLVVAYAVQNFFVFDTAVTLWLLVALFAVLLAREDESKQGSTLFQGRTLDSSVCALIGILLLIPLWWVVAKPLAADYYLAQGYLYQITDVHKSISYFKKGLALGTYADLEYGYTAYDMYTANQAKYLTGASRVAAYEYARDVLVANFKRYPYDTRTAIYLGHVYDTAPPGITVNDNDELSVLARAVELSPKRAQPYYILANIFLKKGDATTGAERTALYKNAIIGLEAYSKTVPTLSEPHYIIANLYFVLGDRANAAREAALGLSSYQGDADVAKRAVKYYLGVEDWPNVVRFFSDIVGEESTDYPTWYDLAKAKYLAQDFVGAEEIVIMLRQKSPGLIETDPAFFSAITTYEQSKK